MTLDALLAPVLPQSHIPPIEIRTLTEDSRQANAYALFVCIKGAVSDGHRYAKNAYDNGCRAFVAQEELSLPQDAFVLTVPDTRLTLSTLACRFFGTPSEHMRLIGITGTKGKTTVAHLLAHILNRSGIPCGYIGTNGITYANVTQPTKNTTPDAVTLQQTLADMLAKGVKNAVIEVSSQALMQHRVDGTSFESVLFTNLSPDHIGTNEHPDFDSYKACKKRLFTDFSSNYTICNLDSEAAGEILSATCSAHTYTCSTQAFDADLTAKDVRLLKDRNRLGVAFTAVQGTETVACVLPLIGKINVSNALLALTVAIKVYGIPLPDAAASLADASISGRSEWIPLPNGASVVIDYAHNGESLRQLLTTLREYHPKRLLVLFGSIGGRAQVRRRELGEVAAELSDLAILTSDNPAHEPPEQILADIEAAFQGFDTPYIKIADRKAAILHALDLTREGDILVLAGKGHETYQLIGNDTLPFSERAIVTAALKVTR